MYYLLEHSELTRSIPECVILRMKSSYLPKQH